MRRHQRDVDGGLLFSWRVPGGSFGRTAVGVVVAAVLFAVFGTLVHIRMPLTSGEIRESATLFVLDPNDPDARSLLDWARHHSPFPDRWEPGSGGVLETMMQGVTAELEDRSRYRPLLRLRMQEHESRSLPGLIGDDPPPPPRPRPRPDVDNPGGVLRGLDTGVIARSWAVGPLAERWGTRTMTWDDQDEGFHIGGEASFSVGVNREGKVDFCLLIDRSGEDVHPRLGQWIRKQVVDSVPEQASRAWDVVHVNLQATEPKEFKRKEP